MRTVIISDCHVGAAESDVEALYSFLAAIECDRLIIAGDLWDLWVRKPGYLHSHYRRFIWSFEYMKERGVQAEYMLGNHDAEYLDDPFISLELLPVVERAEVKLGPNRTLAVIHGHQYDRTIKSYAPWLRLAYRLEQCWRFMLHKDPKYFALAELEAHPCYEKMVRGMHAAAQADYKRKGYAGVVMGHTHWPEHIKGSDFQFVNLGDWKGHNTYAQVDDDKVELLSFGAKIPPV